MAMTPKEEAQQEFKKSTLQLAEDLFNEANQDGTTADDRIKHILKRVGVHQLVLAKKQRFTNGVLIVLSVIMAVGAVFAILAYFCPR